MRRLLSLFLYLLVYKLSFSQSATSHPDSTIKSFDFKTTASIAAYINSNYRTDHDKAWAIYDWVTSNIRYDKDSINSINLGLDPEAKITEALRRRKGVCENFAAIFNDVAIKSGLKSYVIDGYTKQGGEVDKVGHNWCAININNKWYLTDPTWGSGSNVKTKYFLTEPSEFIENHMPFDPLWQCLDYPVTHQQFNSGSVSRGKSFFNYADSINSYLKLDSFAKLQSSANRIIKSGLYNNLVKDRLNFLKMHIEMINQEKDVDLYTKAINDFNQATSVYNNFVNYRNNRFTPAKSDAELQSMLSGIDRKILSAIKKLDQVDKTPATFTFSTEALRTKLNTLLSKVNDQQEFLKRYLATLETDRDSLFYK